MSEGSSGEVKTTVMEEKSEKQQGRASLEKGRSCKGYLYYSSTLKSKAKNPRCVGIPRTLRQVPVYVVGQKEPQTLPNFYYGCLGYSVYMTEKDSSAMKQPTKTQLPFCVGLEMLAERKATSSNTSPVPARVQNRNGARTGDPFGVDPRDHLNHNQNQKPSPAPAPENGFVTRLNRNANLVASGVMKNLKRVGKSRSEKSVGKKILFSSSTSAGGHETRAHPRRLGAPRRTVVQFRPPSPSSALNRTPLLTDKGKEEDRASHGQNADLHRRRLTETRLPPMLNQASPHTSPPLPRDTPLQSGQNIPPPLTSRATAVGNRHP
ncbi:unnamed protein product [Microthlaspi erraticum]|uniref:DUF8204 domain-containing protein n=1 Tax=Microthlaspi erraticum TaxID=1685480 RepID=A0A6D2I2B1_9BRAS|nr:unnamed protein product [Microthlaspi erraticum]